MSIRGRSTSPRPKRPRNDRLLRSRRIIQTARTARRPPGRSEYQLRNLLSLRGIAAIGEPAQRVGSIAGLVVSIAERAGSTAGLVVSIAGLVGSIAERAGSTAGLVVSIAGQVGSI